MIVLFTDFGVSGPYMGQMKAVLHRLAPGVDVVDLFAVAPARDPRASAYLLAAYIDEFPQGTVFLCVVDPGVGSTRRPLAIEAAGYRWVGPDNGLLSFALECPDARAFEITHPDLRRESVSATFHGRDVFAPAAAKLAAGFPIRSVGPSIDDALFLEATQTVASDAGLVGTIVHVDHFGNLISCICTSALAALGDPAHLRVSAGGDPAAIAVTGIVHTYADVQVGSTAALIGSSDLLELVVRDGNAANRFGLRRGDTITVERYP